VLSPTGLHRLSAELQNFKNPTFLGTSIFGNRERNTFITNLSLQENSKKLTSLTFLAKSKFKGKEKIAIYANFAWENGKSI